MKIKIIIPASILIGIVLFLLVKFYFYHPSFYPIKSGVCAWAGDTRILNADNTISNKELEKLQELLQPGDLIINRKDYYVSNYAIPGFWTHASLYVGTDQERKNFFANDEDCKDWVKSYGFGSGELSELLNVSFNDKFSVKYKLWQQNSIVESIGKGVIISSFEEGASKDGIVIFRPNVSKLEIAKGVYNAFEMVSKPYDYNFDFSTDNAIACTELIYKAFEGCELFPVNELLGNSFTTAHDITEYYVNKDDGDTHLSLMYIYYDKHSFIAKETDEAIITLKVSLGETVLW